MAEQSHTPGPWQVFDIRPGEFSEAHVGAGKESIATIEGGNWGRYVSDEQLEADARLIAAAPDMLAAHKENARILGFLVNELQGRIEGGKLAALYGCLERSIAAVEKSATAEHCPIRAERTDG